MGTGLKNRQLCINCCCPSRTRRRGYCMRCYDMVKRIEAAQKWDRTNPTTLERFPSVYDPASKRPVFNTRIILNTFSDDEFDIWRNEYIRQAQSQLEQMRFRGERRRGMVPVKPSDIERQLVGILHLLRPTAQYAQDVSLIVRHFDQGQRRYLYDLLAEIEENIPWSGFDSRKALDLIHQHRLKLSKEIIAKPTDR
jgi:hypothetical protein